MPFKYLKRKDEDEQSGPFKVLRPGSSVNLNNQNQRDLPTPDEILRTVRAGERRKEEQLDLTDRDLTISPGEKQTASDRFSSRLFSPLDELFNKTRGPSITEKIEDSIRKVPGGDEVMGFRDHIRDSFNRVMTGEPQSGTNITPRYRDESFRNRGIIGLIGGKTAVEQYTDRFNSILMTGISAEEADRIAQQDVDILNQDAGPYSLNQIIARQELYESLPEDQAKALKSVKFWENLDIALNAFDVATIGVGGTLGRISKEATERVARSTSRDEIADILRGEFSDVGKMTDEVINPMADMLRHIDNTDDVQKVFDRGVRSQTEGVEQSDNLPILRNPPEPDEVTGFQFVSPNIEEGMDFRGARRALSSERHARMGEIIRNVDTKSSLTTRQKSAIGDWADGAENTFYIEETGGASLNQLRANAAEKGILTNQKAVISFKVGKGDDAVYTVKVDTTDMEKIRKDLSESGLQFRTLLEEAEGVRIAIFDKGDELIEAVNNFATKYGTKAQKRIGTGEFIGGETRSEALKEYRRILEEVRGSGGSGARGRRDGDSVYRGEAEVIEDPQRLLPGEQAVQGDNFFMSSAQNNRWGPEARMRAEQRSISKAKERKAIEARNDRVRTAKEVLDNRRQYVSDLRDRFGLSDSELRKISNNRDIRLMTNYEFKKFIDDMGQRAVEVAETRKAKNELVDFLNEMEFKNEENLRRIKGYPTINKMDAEQLRDYLETLENYSPGDTFLTKRQFELVNRSEELEGVATFREALDRFKKEYKKMTGKDVPQEILEEGIPMNEMERMMGDATLARENPFFELVVKKVHAHLMEAKKMDLDLLYKSEDLAKAANKSRDRGVVGSVRHTLIPQHDEIVNYLQASSDEKSKFARMLTDEELEYANYIQRNFNRVYDHLVKMEELGMSRFQDEYFPHVRKKFLESLNDDGFVRAVKSIWDNHKDSRFVASIIDDDTGNILAKSKFFSHALYRSGSIDPSKNVTRVFRNYMRMAHNKMALDKILIESDIYTQALTPRGLTKNGMETNRKLKTFMNEWLNNKKGRKSSLGGILPQHGKADIGLRMGNTLVSTVDLGGNIFSYTAAMVGEMYATWHALGPIKYAKAWKRRLWDTGIKRKMTKNGSDILKDAENFTGRNIWSEITDTDISVGDRFWMTLYGAFSQATTEANKIFLLGNATKAEMRAGKLSAEKKAEMLLDIARWRDLGSDVKSIFGSTSAGQTVTKYLGWAIPIFNTNMRNLNAIRSNIMERVVRGEGVKGRAKGASDIVTSQEMNETMRLVANMTLAFMIGQHIAAEDDDDSFAGQMKNRIAMEINVLLDGANPATYISVGRLVQFIKDLTDNFTKLIMLEEYQSNTQWGNEGDLRGLKGLQRQFTPAAVKNYSRMFNTESGGGGGQPGASKQDQLRQRLDGGGSQTGMSKQDQLRQRLDGGGSQTGMSKQQLLQERLGN